MRKELLYVAGGMALVLFLGAAPMPNWKGVSVRTDVPGNTSSVSSITFVGGVTAAQFVGSGSLLTGVLKPPDTNGHLDSITNQWWDVDTLTAPASSGSITWTEGGSGESYSSTRIDVWPIYSNAIGKVYGSVLHGEHDSGAATYHTYDWDAQAGAVGYFVHVELVSEMTDHYREQAGTHVDVTAFGGDDVTPKPSSVARTNEVASTFMASTTNLGSFAWSNAIPWDAVGSKPTFQTLAFSNFTSGTVTGGGFLANGEINVAPPGGITLSNSWRVRTAPNGAFAIDGVGGTHIQAAPGAGPRLMMPVADEYDALVTKNWVTNYAPTVAASSAFVTNGTPIAVDATNALPSVSCDAVTIINGTNYTMIVGQGGIYVEVAAGCGIGPLGGITNANAISWAGKDGEITNAIYRWERVARP